MRRLCNAVRVFFLALFSGEVAEQVGPLLARRRLAKQAADSPAVAAESESKPAKAEKDPKHARGKPVRSEALTLLATLQREARLVDFLQERLETYSDAQIGAVARDVHRDCSKAVERMFALAPVVDQEEGSPLEVPSGFDAARYRLTGNVAGEPPFRGRVVHHGWEATRCEVPTWTGSEAGARIVAPVEIEL